MIDSNLHKTPVALDREQHRKLRLTATAPAYARTAGLNALFVTAAEFRDVCREYAIVFVRAGTNPQTQQPEIAPMAVLGLAQGENLMLEDGGQRWGASYVPAVLRAYPFGLAQVDTDRYAVCFDSSFEGLSSEGEGRALFEADGKPTSFLTETQKFVESIETETQRTRHFCQRLLQLGLLNGMRFDATLPEGHKITVDGFLAVDDKKLSELPDATVVELHRNGLLGLIHAHQISLGHMRRLVERRLARTALA